MRKRRILAALLAACMIMESTTAASAAETAASTVNTVESETETAAEEAGLDDAQDTAETDSEADDKAETPEEETADKSEEDAGKESPEDTEQPPEETGAGEEEQDSSAEEAEAENPEELPAEEDLVGAAEVMEAEPLTDGELIKNQTDWEITDLKLRQEYGGIALVWAYDYDKTSTADTVFDHCNLYRSETGNDDDYELILETNESDGHYHYEDKNVERVDGQAVNKTYYYKVGAVYNRDIRDENNFSVGREKCESKLLSISNEDAYYYENAYPFFLNDESDYIGAYVTDDERKRLDSLTIKEGEPQSLRLILVDADGNAEQLSGQYYTEWHLCRRYYTGQEIRETYSEEFDQLGTDKVQIVPEMNLSAGTMNDLHVNITALNGSARDEEYYLVVKTNHNQLGWFTWQIPVHIDEGDGTYTPPSEMEGLYFTKEALCQAIRDAMVDRKEETVLYATGGYEWWNTSNNPSSLDLDFEDVFDFHRERADMKPCEGDYLLLAMGDASSEVYFGTWLEMKDSTFVYGSQYLKQYTITPSFITTKEQEKQVDDKIQEIIYQPGGALSNYQNASDYAKIKAAYDYVRSNVSYIGTPTPIYHTAYSALINKKATCQGYALLFYRLVRELGIPCRVLMGTDANAHTYNIVELGGKWYYVDTNAGVLLKGTKDFTPATLQPQYQTEAFRAEYISKISVESYVGSAESELLGVVSLNDTEIQAIAPNLTKAADAMKATYTINGATIRATGTIQYKEGCTGYLGYEEGTSSTNGYFLALKLNVSGEAFQQDGRMTVSYLAEDGTRKEKSYSQEDLKGGNVNLLVKVTKDPSLKISVDYDGDGEQSKYDAKLYGLDISGLKKERQDKSTGSITDKNEYGIEPSSPIITKNADGTEIRVTYEAVAYSDKVTLEGLPESESKGNYILLEMGMPESVKGTTLANSVKIAETTDGTQPLESGWNATQKCFVKIEKMEKSSWIRIGMPVTLLTMRKFEIQWGDDDKYAVKQNLYITVPANSALETRSESALLPGSIAFNGFVSTMYVGQNQNIHISFKKKYEEDEIQVYYTSDAAEVLTVNRITGVMKALKPGTANITVSAVDKNGNTIDAKPAKITVKELPAPTGIKVASVKDTSVTVSWKANTTGTATEVYAIPYNSSTFSPNKKKEWKNVVENALKVAKLDEKVLAKMEATEKENALKTLGESFGVESCVAESVPAKDSTAVLNGLEPQKEYLFYVRNVSVTAASTVAFAGATSDKATKTTTRIFDSIRLTLTPEAGEPVMSNPVNEAGNSAAVYEVTSANQDTAVALSYAFLDGEGKQITDSEFKNVKYNSTNKNIVQVQTSKDAQPSLKYGNQVGEARITVSGKDASGVVRESEPIIVRVVKAPSQLKDKSTTLTVGQSIPITELIGTDLKGTAEGMDLTGVDFANALTAIESAGCFAISYPTGETKETAPQKAIITATTLIEKKSGNKAEVSFKMKDNSSSAMAKIQIKDMAAATIGKITVKDTSAVIEFKPSAAVMEITENRYYTLQITDKVTGEPLEAAADTCTFKESVPGKTWICEVKGLSSNKAYEVVITAHFKAETADSKPKKFTTKKPLLATAGTMDINYVSLDKLRKDPNAVGTKINYSPEGGIKLENNGTYVFMAQVSNLARTLETDKLKWTISSGDKRAASIKASSSSYEMQLTTTRTGTFTVTAASTVTKEAVATFTVEVIPYQSGGAGSTDAGDQGAAQTTALLPEVDLSGLFKSREEDAA